LVKFICSGITPVIHSLLFIETVDICLPVIVYVLPGIALPLLPSVVILPVYIALPIG
jgi:hypothetical protein